jgi:thioredoxin-related protein
MMRFRTGLAGLVVACATLASLPAWAAEWMTDYDKALQEAKKTDKAVLIDFTGSDWCGWCIRLKQEVFDTEAFQKWADKNVVLVEIDMPRQKQLPEALHRQNESLRLKYHIQGFPTIVFLDSQGKEVGRSGYLAGGPDKWLPVADKIIGDGRPKMEVVTSLANGIAQAKAKNRPMLLIVDPNCDKDVDKLFADRKLVRFANRRLVVVHLKGELSKDETGAFGEFRTKCGIKDDPATIMLIDQAQTKLLMSQPKVPAAADLLKSVRDALPKLTYDGAWIDDYAKAEQLAEELDRPMLLDFTGSDWCGWCMKLDDEVFSKPEFKKYAKENLILVKLDFPKQKELPPAIKEQNDKLLRKYSIRGFPTLIILSPDGEKIGQMGYMKGGPDPFLKQLGQTIDTWREANKKEGVAKAEPRT